METPLRWEGEHEVDTILDPYNISEYSDIDGVVDISNCLRIDLTHCPSIDQFLVHNVSVIAETVQASAL